MKITIIQIGKTRQKYFQDAEAEYLKRLQPYAKIRIITLKECAAPNSGQAGQQISKNKEGETILVNLKPESFIIALDPKGKSFDSLQFADLIKQNKDFHGADLTFIIGGPYGLSGAVLKAAKLKLSFSSFTFTHELIRTLLLEQIYRAFTIMSGKSYHY